MAQEFDAVADSPGERAGADERAMVGGECRRESETHRGLSPPQFSVASLLAGVTLVAFVLALSDVIGAYGTFWLVIFLVAVFAHIAGNALGHQLRANGHAPGDSSTRPPGSVDVEYAPRTQLGDRSSIGHWVVAATFVGALGGAIGGGYWLTHSLGDQFTVSSLLVALVAFAVLGGIWSFLSVGFLYVLIGAWRQSSRHK